MNANVFLESYDRSMLRMPLWPPHLKHGVSELEKEHERTSKMIKELKS